MGFVNELKRRNVIRMAGLARIGDRTDPLVASLVSDPRYATFMEKLGLPK